MKQLRYFWIIGLFFIGTNLFADAVEQRIEVNLSDNWQFSQARKEEWRKAVVPGTVHQDLINHDLLPNPFWGLNEEKIQWVETVDWEYKTTFNLTAKELSFDGAELFFEGLDTYADVYLNGSLLFKSDNMFVGYKQDVKKVLREGENRLHIYFHSPINYVLPQWSSNGFDYPADNDHHEKKLSIFTRKAPYSYGWDWGIRMVTSGVWRPITLSFYDIASIDDLHIKQNAISSSLADLSIELEIASLSEVEDIKAEFSFGKEANKELVVKSVNLVEGINRLSLPVKIDNPDLWMPNGWGEPHLYDFIVSLKNADGVVFATKSVRTGLRTIRLVHEPDEKGRSFYFEVNGTPMFAKGANYIPDDALLPNITAERYQTLFRDIKEANMNMVRVWGGGSYEDDLFYQLADENGILVWQDFMFGCTTYPHDPSFLARVEEEAIYNIKRLRNYASLSLWCGNNEIQEGIKYWGWNKRFDTDVYDGMKEGYEVLYNELLPRIVNTYDADRCYVHGSPYSSNWGRPESWASGDSHNWGIWYGRKPFESLDTELSRFMSEFGFQSFPEMKTISTFAEPKDYQLESDVMNGHQKASVGNELIEASMKRYFKVPEKFEDFVYVGLVLQGEGMRHGFEAHRRNMPYCMGTLYWQLNDSWPVVSWASIDYYGNWKALHYQAQRAFAPVLINSIQEEDDLAIYLISDRLDDLTNLTLSYELIDFSGRRIKKGEFENFTLESNSVKQIDKRSLGRYVSDDLKSKTVLRFQLKQKNSVIAEELHYFAYTKDLELVDPKISTKLKRVSDGYELSVKSNQLVKDLFIEVPMQGARFSDNFFDLLPGTTKKIMITLPNKNEVLSKEQIEIKHIKDTY